MTDPVATIPVSELDCYQDDEELTTIPVVPDDEEELEASDHDVEVTEFADEFGWQDNVEVTDAVCPDSATVELSRPEEVQ